MVEIEISGRSRPSRFGRKVLWGAMLIIAFAAATGCEKKEIHVQQIEINEVDSSMKSEPVYGLDAIAQIARLPYLKVNTTAGGASSYDRTGENNDGFANPANYHYLDEHGDRVLLDVQGAGTIYRIWTTGFNANDAYMKFYFDGEPTPRINILLKDMYSGTQAPFLAPLVLNDKGSSGGFVSYLPLPFHQSIKITTNGFYYYNIGYEQVHGEQQIASWTGEEDSTAARRLWNQAGVDPAGEETDQAVSGTVRVNGTDSAKLVELKGPRMITSIKLQVPGLVNQRYKTTPITGLGKSHKGETEFVAKIDSGNQGVTLVRRLDYSVAFQKAEVYVDGEYAGVWFDDGFDFDYRWRNSAFEIPARLTSGKSSVQLRLKYIGENSFSWNEFYYWIYSHVDGAPKYAKYANNYSQWNEPPLRGDGLLLTDELEITNQQAEQAHHYSTSLSDKPYMTALYPPPYLQVEDDGRTLTGFSEFTMALDPENQGAFLNRRYDQTVGSGQADVYVDGKMAGRWTQLGTASEDRWNESNFYVPESFTGGKSSATIRIEPVKGGSGWSEFYYKMFSINGNGKFLTDELDVGQAQSEARHAYTSEGEKWSGKRVSNYEMPDEEALKLLKNLRLRIFWDGELEPSVDAPIGSLFGMGDYELSDLKTPFMGIDEENRLYLNFPMPFANHAAIELVNDGETDVTGIRYEIAHQPFQDSFADVGYFKTSYTHAVGRAGDGQDLVILDVRGTGHFVGVVQNNDHVRMFQNISGRWHLEGDERIYVDDSKSPAIHGTGAEDFYNGGWYFNKGLYASPMAGYTTFYIADNFEYSSMFRLMVQDAVPFRKRIQVSIEHGGLNDVDQDAYMLAYYYLQPEERLILTDQVDVGDDSSESKHAYEIEGRSWEGSLSSQYEGIYDRETIEDTGNAHEGSSEFNMAVDVRNTGVILRRRFDQQGFGQRANVYVDGKLAGEWYMAGGNTTHRFRDDDFWIPPELTAGKQEIIVKVEYISGAAWSEFRYEAFSLLASAVNPD